MSNGLEPECRGDWITPDPYAPSAADTIGITNAARQYLQYRADVSGTGFATGRLLPIQKRITSTAAIVQMAKIRAIAAATESQPAGSPVLRRGVLPAVQAVIDVAGCSLGS